ncbi:MAG: TonB family protein [Candidatus Sulfotelmatobacter sp.]
MGRITMFEDSLIESGGKLKTKRGWTSIISFAIQIGIVGVMVLIPLIFTEALPKGTTLFMLVAPPPPPPPPPPAAAPVHVVKQIQSDIVNGELRTPTKIPKKILENLKEDEAPPQMAVTGVVGGVPGGVPGGSMGGVIGSVLSSTPVAVPKIATPQRVRVSSGVSSGLLIRKVSPTYPPLARQARIQGTVILQAQISKDGSIQNLQLISGHPMLAPAAIEAVKQWKYKPYLLNGEPVEVETQVQVNFTLAGG